MYQSGDREGPNIKHHLEMNIASVIRDAMNPAFEAAKAKIEAGSSSEEIAKAVLGEYAKANEQFTLSRRNAVLEQKTSREAKEQAAAKALAEEQAVLRSRMSGKGGKGDGKGEQHKGKGEQVKAKEAKADNT